jgi:hypothetical protein
MLCEVKFSGQIMCSQNSVNNSCFVLVAIVFLLVMSPPGLFSSSPGPHSGPPQADQGLLELQCLEDIQEEAPRPWKNLSLLSPFPSPALGSNLSCQAGPFLGGQCLQGLPKQQLAGWAWNPQGLCWPLSYDSLSILVLPSRCKPQHAYSDNFFSGDFGSS